MTYKESWYVVKTWTFLMTRENLRTLPPGFIRDIAMLRVHHRAIYREIRDAIEGPRPPSTQRHNGRAWDRVTTYAALQARIAQDPPKES